MGDSIMSQSKNPVVRSLVVEAGILNAHADGMVRLWPRHGRARNTRLPETATCLLALIGPQGKVWRVAIGDRSGAITLMPRSNPMVSPTEMTVSTRVRKAVLSGMR